MLNIIHFTSRRIFAFTTSSFNSIISILYHCIFSIKFMAMNAMCFSSIYGCQTVASQNISNQINWFHMFWIYAMPSTAKMIDLFSFGDWANKQFVRYSVCHTVFVLKKYNAITIRVFTPSPKPASFSFFNGAQKSFLHSHWTNMELAK